MANRDDERGRAVGHPLLVSLGSRVRELRAERGLTRRALAERSLLSERFVAEVEGGRANISVVNLEGVARALGVSAAALLEPAAGGVVVPGVIALLGLRGAGKSTVGRQLAARLGAPFFELDQLVEAEAGMQLSEIFAIHGEGYFRQQEFRALERFLAGRKRAVLAAGGGIVSSGEAFSALLQRTRTVWLKARPEEHWARVVGQGDLRPMQDRPQAMAELKRRLKEREPLYARAHLTVSTSGREVAEVVEEVVSSLGSPRGG